jgi:hypothetical protein
MREDYDLHDHYWLVGDARAVWSSREAIAAGQFSTGYVASDHPGYVAFLAAERLPTRIGSEDELRELALWRRLVPRATIIDRLHSAGKLDAARAALDAADLYTRERWNARDAIYADDATAIALLNAIGANASEILA